MAGSGAYAVAGAGVALAEADRARRAHQLRHAIVLGKISKKAAKLAFRYAKIGAKAVATVAKKEVAKIKDKRAARHAAYAEQQRKALDAGDIEDDLKVGAAMHVSASALVSASTGEGMRDLRTGKKLVW